jgi:hypothetical protein
MAVHLTKYQREYFKQLIIECQVQRLSREESLAYCRSRLKKDVSIEYYHVVKRSLKQNIESKLEHLRKSRTAYVEQFFKRIDEIEKYMQELWRIIRQNSTDGLLIRNCIHELHELTITLSNLWEVLPAFTGSSLLPIESYNNLDNRNHVLDRNRMDSRDTKASPYKDDQDDDMILEDNDNDNDESVSE